MIKTVMSTNANIFPMGINMLFKFLKTELFITKTVGELISGKIKIRLNSTARAEYV